MKTLGNWFFFLVLAMAATSLSAIDSSAEPAKDLKCKGCVGKKNLGKRAVNRRNIANRAVNGKKIADGVITPLHLATPTGAAGIEGDDATSIVNGQIVSTLVVAIPGAGVVAVDATGYFRFLSPGDSGTCGISAGTTQDGPVASASGSSASTQNRSPFAVTRAFVETSGGTKTYRLMCGLGPGDDIDVLSTSMTAIYAPTNILVE